MLIALVNWHLRRSPFTPSADADASGHVSQVHWASGDWPGRFLRPRSVILY
jgi:hypothetical protein